MESRVLSRIEAGIARVENALVYLVVGEDCSGNKTFFEGLLEAGVV